MDANIIINYKNGLNNIKERISILKIQLSELQELELKKNSILKKCNHNLLLVYANDKRLIGPVKVGYCLICDEIIYIPWNNNYLKSIKFDFDSILDVSDILENNDYYGLTDFEIKNLQKQKQNECINCAKTLFHKYLNDSLITKKEMNIEEIKNDIREEIVKLNKNFIKNKELK